MYNATNPDPHALRRDLALQQVGTLTRLADLGMQLAEVAAARALAAEAQPPAAKAGAALPEDVAPAPAPAPAATDNPGRDFARFALAVRQALALRTRTLDGLCAQDRADRKARRARHRGEVLDILHDLIWFGTERNREALTDDLNERIRDLYEDEEDRVEDRPVASVVTDLCCGLDLVREWHRRRGEFACGPQPDRPSGSAAAVRAERSRRQAAVTAILDQAIAGVPDPRRIPDLQAGLAARMQEADVEDLLDTESVEVAAIRLCRSLGLSPGDLEIHLLAAADTG